MLNYEILGQSQTETIIFLHGNGADLNELRPTAQILKEDYRCVLVDSLGHGKSPATQKYSYVEMAYEVVKLTESLEIDNYYIVGFSDGGILALIINALYPKMTKKIFGIGVNIRADGLKPHIRAGFKVSQIYYSLNKNPAKEAQFKLMLSDKYFDQSILKKEKGKIDLVFGKDDVVTKKHISEIEALTDAKIIITQGDHFGLIKQPAILADEIKKSFNTQTEQ